MKLIANNLIYEYSKEESDSVRALDDVSFVIEEGSFNAIIGHTGSGKSTLLQILNGLIKPDSGTVYFNGVDVFSKDYNLKELRNKIGLVFQYPEHQLFEETAFKDVCFGPKNMGLSRKESELRAFEALKAVKLEDEYFYQSPFDMSGGQKRRVAIAGVLAMKPEILILDEPTAGLDPAGRREILNLLKTLQINNKITIIMVSHSMDDVSEYADRILVLDHGKIIYNDVSREVFKHHAELEDIGLGVPQVRIIMKQLFNNGIEVDKDAINIEEAKVSIMSWYNDLLRGSM